MAWLQCFGQEEWGCSRRTLAAAAERGWWWRAVSGLTFGLWLPEAGAWRVELELILPGPCLVLQTPAQPWAATPPLHPLLLHELMVGWLVGDDLLDAIDDAAMLLGAEAHEDLGPVEHYVQAHLVQS